jgi:hypothetical protein
MLARQALYHLSNSRCFIFFLILICDLFAEWCPAELSPCPWCLNSPGGSSKGGGHSHRVPATKVFTLVSQSDSFYLIELNQLWGAGIMEKFLIATKGSECFK